MTTTNSDAPPQVSRNCQIDLLRVIFTVLTVLQHSIILNIDNVNLPYSHAGDFAVEFFFCVSGYYMVSSWEKSLDRFPNDNLNNTLSFMKHKFNGIVYQYLVGFLLAMIIVPLPNLLNKSIGALDLLDNAIKHIPEFFGVYGAGYTIYDINGNSVSWYISCMLLCMLVLYPLLCKFKRHFLCIGCPFIGVVLLALRYHDFGTFGTWTQWGGTPFIRWYDKSNRRIMLWRFCLCPCKENQSYLFYQIRENIIWNY